MPTQTQLERYADVLIRIGINVQPGQPVSIVSPIETAYFARILASRLYDAGSGTVEIEWTDPLYSRLHLEKAPEHSLTHVPRWQIQQQEEQVEENTAFVYIDAEDPDLLSGVDPARVNLRRTARGKAFKKIDDWFMADRVSWLVCSIPSERWACKMFPDAPSGEAAVDELWAAIFTVMRMKEDDPVDAWQRHFEDLERRAAFLNEQHVRRLEYRAPGTNLSLALPQGHLWVAARSTNAAGAWFSANLPTEEIYTLPARDGANGTVRATMPLSRSGVVIEGIELRLENGRIVDYHADAGYETLKEIIETDEGSHFLGEVALVSVDSPIRKLQRLFYNTLFDENASCHLAIGRAYPTCLADGRDMTDEQLQAHGANDSITHTDFMIGSDEMDIDAVLDDGRVVPIQRKGRWAF